MRSLVAAFLLTGVVGSTAAAEWTVIDSQPSRSIFADLGSIRRTGDTARIWTLINYSKPQPGKGKNYRSVTNLTEVDCNEERVRLLQGSIFTGKMGGGEIVVSDNSPRDWEYVQPGSLNELQRSIACKLR
jgi:hypothetical protein